MKASLSLAESPKSVLTQDPVTHKAPTCARAANEHGWLLDQPADQTDIGNRSHRFSQVVMEIQRTPAREGSRWGRTALVCSSVHRLARMPSITAGTKEEHQIRVRTEFGVERGRTRIEGERIRVEEFWSVSIGLVTLNRP
jgi:hypothetical protein